MTHVGLSVQYTFRRAVPRKTRQSCMTTQLQTSTSTDTPAPPRTCNATHPCRPRDAHGLHAQHVHRLTVPVCPGICVVWPWRVRVFHGHWQRLYHLAGNACMTTWVSHGTYTADPGPLALPSLAPSASLLNTFPRHTHATCSRWPRFVSHGLHSACVPAGKPKCPQHRHGHGGLRPWPSGNRRNPRPQFSMIPLLRAQGVHPSAYAPHVPRRTSTQP